MSAQTTRTSLPSMRNQKMTPEPPKQLPEREEVERDHEWLQLIQIEKMIERQKQEWLKTGAQDLEDEDEAWGELQEAEGSPVKEEDESLDDGDLTYITTILNSFSKTKLNCKQPSTSELPPFTPEGALMRAPAQIMPPPKFNQKFNQNSTSYGSEDRNFSCFSNFEEEGTTELADYFSDKEDDSLDNEDPTGESDNWSQSNFDELGEISDDKDAWSEQHRATKFGLESIQEIDYEETGEKNNLKGIASISKEAKLAFSEWQPYIPPELVFQNSFAQSWRPAFLQPASSSQEPTLIQISTIAGPIATTKQTPALRLAIIPRQKMTPSQQQDWNSFRPMRHYTHTWRKPCPGSSKTCNRTRNSQNEFQDHPGQSKPSRQWKQPSPCLPKTIQNQNTKFRNTPPATNVGNAPQVFTQFQSQIYLNTRSNRNTTRTKSLETKWRKSFNKTQTFRTKLPKNTERHLKNSRRSPLWLWSPKPWPPICSLSTATTEKPNLKRKISPRGENHFSKRRSESKSYSKYRRINKRHRSESSDKNSKSKSKNESKDIKVRNENKLVTFSTDAEAKVTAKVDEVKAIGKALAEFRMEIGKQLDQKIGPDLPVTLPLRFATTFNISVLTCVCVTFTIFISIFNIFILISNPFFSDLFDHHLQTFSLGSLRVYEMLCASQKTASSQAKTAVTAFATPDSIRSFRVSETRPNMLYRSLHKNTLVPKHLRSLGRSRNPENDFYNDSFILIYLDLSR
jgi:hypothetical protein